MGIISMKARFDRFEALFLALNINANELLFLFNFDTSFWTIRNFR